MTRTEQNDTSAVTAHPRVTPELVDYYVREGRRLRALTLRRMGRQVAGAVVARLRGRRRMGRLKTRAAG